MPEKVTKKKDRSGEEEDMDFDDDDLESGVTFMVWGAYFSEVDYLGFEGEHG